MLSIAVVAAVANHTGSRIHDALQHLPIVGQAHWWKKFHRPSTVVFALLFTLRRGNHAQKQELNRAPHATTEQLRVCCRKSILYRLLIRSCREHEPSCIQQIRQIRSKDDFFRAIFEAVGPLCNIRRMQKDRRLTSTEAQWRIQLVYKEGRDPPHVCVPMFYCVNNPLLHNAAN